MDGEEEFPIIDPNADTGGLLLTYTEGPMVINEMCSLKQETW